MNYATNIFKIVTWFLTNKPMTHKKLQKLLYFSYGIYLAQNNCDVDSLDNQLFENKFEAWVHGPVDPTVYSVFKNNGINELFIEKPVTINFDEKIMSALNKTMELYGDYDADELERETHMQAPWIKARNGIEATEVSTTRLSEREIFLTFQKIING